MIRVNRQIKCPNNLFFVLGNLMVSWIVFILHRKIFPIHHTYIYSLVSYLFIKQDQMILICISAVASLMLSRFFSICFEILTWYLVCGCIMISYRSSVRFEIKNGGWVDGSLKNSSAIFAVFLCFMKF
jgi:hypothetical protein